MRIELHTVGWLDFRPWHAKPGDVRGSLAWSNVRDGVGHVYVRRWMQWLLWGLARIGHELEHCLDPTFRTLGGFDPHGEHRRHGCLRAYSFRRSWDCARKATPELARMLRRAGVLEVA